MKALTLTQPWASLMANNVKRIETRSWGTSHRGELAIHAAKWWSQMDRAIARQWDRIHGEAVPFMPLGAVVAIVHLSACFEVARTVSGPAGRCGAVDTTGERWFFDPEEYVYGDIRPGRWLWVLHRPRVLIDPIPARGAQRLWEWSPPPTMRTRR
jgi:hypothetical protein